MPHILFDARSLAEHGGVSRVAARVLAYVRDTRPEADIVTVTTGHVVVDTQDAHVGSWVYQATARGRASSAGWRIPSPKSPNVRFGDHRDIAHIHLRLPNKLWSLLCFLGLTSLDRAAAQKTQKTFDELILPNVGFVGTPKVPYTVVVHDLSFLIEPRWFPWRMRLWHHAVRATTLIQRAAQVWCVSHTTANDVTQLLNVPCDRITILPTEIVTGISVHHDTPASLPLVTSNPLPSFVLAFTGSPRKNSGTAMAAVARVRRDPRFRNLTLVIIGAVPRVQPPLPEWIIALPHVSDRELHQLYARAAALLYPSWYEGFGLPLHEAAAFHIPLLASAHGALPETAPPGTILIPPAKPHLWASALHDVLLHSA